jgi:Protein of unknown function (DUF3551)
MMRKLVASAALLAALVAADGPAEAYDGPWCAHYFGTDYTVNCSLLSFEMCRRETHGIGGTFCSPNPAYRAAFHTPAPAAQRRHHRHLL